MERLGSWESGNLGIWEATGDGMERGWVGGGGRGMREDGQLAITYCIPYETV